MKLKKFTALATAMCMIFSMATAVFAAGDGTQANPEVLTELTGDTVTVTGEYASYVYNYTIPNTVEGTVGITVEVAEDHEDTEFGITMDNLTTGTYTMYGVNPGWGLYSDVIKGKAGDVIKIQVTSYTDEVNVTWTATMSEVGNAEKPDAIGQIMEQPTLLETVIIPGTEGYYYSFVNENDPGIFAICIDENATVDLYSKYPTIVEDDPLLVNSMEELKAEIVLTNKTTNEVVKYSEGTEIFTVLNKGTGESTDYKIIQIPYKAGEEVIIQVTSAAAGYENGVNVVYGAFNLEPVGSYSNPLKLAADSTTFELEPYGAYFIKVNGAYAQFAMSVTGEGEFTVTDMYSSEEYTNHDNVVLVQDEESNEYGFYVLNMSEGNVTYTVKFDIPLGNDLNREKLDTNDKTEYTFDAGDVSTYYCTWTAPEDGIVKFNVTSDNAWTYSVSNTTSGYIGSNIGSYDEKAFHEALDVKKGDELVIYISATDKDGGVTKATKVETTVAFTATEAGIVDTEVVDKIVDDITNEEYEAGSTVTIEMDEATVIPAEVLKAIIEHNKLLAADEEKPLALEIVMDAGTWTITNVTSATPIDLSVVFDTKNTATTVIDKVANGNAYKTFTIAHNGDFGFDAKFTFTYDKDFAGKKATLYWDNNGNLVSIGSCTVDAKGNVAFDMDHASDYVVVVEGTADVEPDSTPTPDNTGNGGVGAGGQQVKPGDSANIVMLFALAAIAGAVVLTKKKTVME